VRLWFKLALAMVAVSLAPLVVVSIQAVDLTSDQAAQARQAARTREAVAVADEIGRWVALKAQAVRGWASLYPDLLSRGPAVQDGLLKATYRAVPGVVTVALLNDDGLVGPPGQELPPRWLDASLSPNDPLAERPRGSKSRADAFLERVPRPDVPGQVWLGEPYTPPPIAPGAPVPGPGLPIGARGPFAERAVLAVDLSLDEVDALLELRARDGRGFALVLADGSPVLGHGPPVDLDVLEPLLGTNTAAFRVEDEGRAGALATVPGVPWTVVMSEPITADPAWPRLQRRLGVSLGVSLVVAVLAGLVVARTVSRPVAQVRTAANRIAEGDLEHRVPATGRDEIGELAQSFNHMAARLAVTLDELEARRAEVEAFNEELQDRVRARTAELEAAQAELLRAGQLAAVAEVGAGLAHEINNPLASVLGLLQVGAHRADDPAVKGLLSQAEAEAQRCRAVVEAMLQLSSDDARDPGPGGSAGEGSEVPGEASDLASILPEVVRVVEAASSQRGVVIALGPTPEPPGACRVAVDEVALRRALTQVLQGLVAGLPDGASLQVGLSQLDPDRAQVELVPDRAVAAGARRDDYRAAGLGLWVARRLISASGGRLDAPDDGEGPWRLTLPRA